MPEPSEVLRETLTSWLEEAGKIRFSLSVPAVTDGPDVLHRQLVQSRSVLDRIEEKVAQLIRLKASTRDRLLDARFVLEESETTALDARRIPFHEYTTKKERYAWIASETRKETEASVRAEQIDEFVGAALDEMRLYHRGVESVRREVDTRLRVMGFERQIER